VTAPHQTFSRAPRSSYYGSCIGLTAAYPRLLAAASERERKTYLVFESLLVKASVGWLCAVPAIILGSSTNQISEQIALFAGAIAAAGIVWTQVIRPLIKGIANLNDAYKAAVIAERQIQEIREDIAELKGAINAKD
jgi:hypothetical protein